MPRHASHVRLGYLLIAVPILALVYYLTSGSKAQPLTPAWVADSFGSPAHPHLLPENTKDLEILRKLEIQPVFEYRRHCITAKPKRGLARQQLINVTTQDLWNEPVGVTLTADFEELPGCLNSFSMDVPSFHGLSKTDTSPIMLGVATTLKRVDPSLHSFARWLANTGSVLIVLLVDQPNLARNADEIEETRAKAASMGIRLIFEPFTGSSKAIEGSKNFALAELFVKHQTRETKWFGVIEDDTFFVSLPQMLGALKPYDPKEQWYIGALSEGHSHIAKEGYQAQSGAGFFISSPLMELVAKNSQQCLKLDKSSGESLWRDCIFEFTSPTVGLTEMRGLSQIDMAKDVSGWYEFGQSPLYTLHNWKSSHFHPIPIAHMVSDVAGPDVFLQRYKFADDIMFVNGFSAIRYPGGLPDINLAEMTMSEDIDHETPPDKIEYHHSLGRMRPPLKLGKYKVVWKFRTSVVADGGNTIRQFYVKAADKDGNPGGYDSVMEIDWKRG